MKSTISDSVPVKRNRVATMRLSEDPHQHRMRFWMILACVITFTGCIKVGPNFTRPELQVSQQWLETGNDRVRTSPADYRMWWTAFKDPVLDTLIQMAYAQNIPLRVAGARVFQARARLGIAIGEQYPQVQQATGSAMSIRESERAPDAPQHKEPGEQFQYKQAQVAGELGWEIDFWGKFRRAVESEDANFLSSIAAYDNALVILTADVASTYVAIRTFEERLRITFENVNIQKESLQIAKARFKAGSGNGLDVQQALAQLRNTEAAVPPLEASLRQAKNALCILLGTPPGNLDQILGKPSGIPQAPLKVAVGIPSDLLRRRPDIRNAELQAAAQCARIGVSRADLYPTFSLTGSFGFLASDVGRFGMGDMTNWYSRYGSYGPSFSWNILNYGQITNNVRVQDARFQELIFRYQNTVLRAQQEVEDAMTGFLQSWKSKILLTEAVAAAKQAVKLAVIQYRNGATDYTTVITSQQILLDGQESLAVARGAVPQGLVGIYRSLGGGWELREGKPYLPAEITATMGNRTDWGALLEPEAVKPPDTRQLWTPDW
jgi:NodT family efflux transporter outer membrane factor (OMF) lipoprotein